MAKKKKKTEEVSKLDLVEALQDLDYTEEEIKKVLSTMDSSKEFALPKRKFKEREPAKRDFEKEEEPMVGELVTVKEGDQKKPQEKPKPKKKLQKKEKIKEPLLDEYERRKKIQQMDQLAYQMAMEKKRREELHSFVEKETNLIWKVILALILFVLFVVTVSMGLVFLYA